MFVSKDRRFKFTFSRYFPADTGKGTNSGSRAHLVVMDRYERRALSRRKFAIATLTPTAIRPRNVVEVCFNEVLDTSSVSSRSKWCCALKLVGGWDSCRLAAIGMGTAVSEMSPDPNHLRGAMGLAHASCAEGAQAVRQSGRGGRARSARGARAAWLKPRRFLPLPQPAAALHSRWALS